PLSVSPAPLRFYCPGHHRHLHSFPTRRSSDLKFVQLTPPEDEPATGQLSDGDVIATSNSRTATDIEQVLGALSLLLNGGGVDQLDRKSTRLNSSHVKISYAVFCLKKKKHDKKR